MKLNITKINEDDLEKIAAYVASQLNNFFPNNSESSDKVIIKASLSFALIRMQEIKRVVRAYHESIFDTFHSMEYGTFLYILANTIYLAKENIELCDRLFLLNRSLNSIDLFYKNTMPKIFLIAHGLGCVIGNATYGNNFVFFQNTTIGRIGNNAPVIGDNVIIYPNCVITGKTNIGSNCVISAGTVIHNKVIENNSLVKSVGSEIIVKPLLKDYLSYYFREV